MTRIIAGKYGGMPLKSSASGTRPTQDRVKEAVFSKLLHLQVLAEARVLDLFAGTGALGFESLSRGAASCTLVDNSAAAVALCKKNAALFPAENVKIVKATAASYLAKESERWLAEPALAPTLIFVDPPYELKSESVASLLNPMLPLFSDEVTVILERDKRSTPVPMAPGWKLIQEKAYGETFIQFFSNFSS